MITASPTENTRWLLADWLELETLCSSDATASVHSINYDPHVEPDAEPDALDEDGLRHEERIARVTREVETRRSSLKDTYPFTMSEDGGRLERRPQTGVGSTVYLFCLLASHARSGGLLVDTDLVPIGDVPDLLQACATWSAAGYEQGPAFALGLEPGTHTFLSKLARIYSAFGDGTPVTSIPPGAPKYVKDDGVDVIAWKAMGDQTPPATYLMGQVASGRNWVDKSMKDKIAAFHATWFAPQPARDARAAIMIPFCIDASLDDDEAVEQAALAMHFRRVAGRYGELFYRYRLPLFAQQGLKLHSEGTHVDMVDWMPRVEAFVERAITKLRTHHR